MILAVSNKKEIRADIQGLRGIAVLAVLIGHAFPYTFKNGYLGVDVFFCISGFVIAPLLYEIKSDEKTKSIIRFLSFVTRRFFRLVPAFLVVALAFSLMFLFFSPIEDFRRISNQIIFSIPFLGNIGSHYFVGNYFQPSQNPFLHTWSVAVEFQTYVVVGLLYLIIQRKIQMYLLLISLISFMVFIVYLHESSLFLDYYSLLPRLWEILFGLILYNLSVKRQIPVTDVFAKLTLILLLVFLFSTNQIQRSIGTLTVILGCAILLCNKDFKISWLKSKLLVWVGDRSYSLYLIHVPLIYLIQYSFVSDVWSNFVFKWMIISICFPLSNYLHTYIEKPFKKNNGSGAVIFICFVMLVPLLVTLRFHTPPNTVSYTSHVNSTEPWVRSSGCQIFGEPLNPLPMPCKISNHSDVVDSKWLLIGDSHAAMFSESILSLANNKKIDLYVFTQYACPFFMQEVKVSSPAAKNCVEHNLRTKKWILSINPDIVITASRSVGIQQGLDLFREALLGMEFDAHKYLMSRGVSILRIGTVPETSKYKSNIEKLLPSLRFQSDFKKSVEVNSHWKEFAKVNQISYVDVFDIMCLSKDDCNTSKNRTPFYYDSNHLNDFGTNLVIQSAYNLFPN